MHILEDKYGGDEPFKGGFNKNTNINKMQIKNKVFGYGGLGSH
jgi:hypothetical protein